MQITESLVDLHRYHFSEDGKHWKALCGAITMRTSIPLDAWGKLGRRSSWCAECARLRGLNAAQTSIDAPNPAE